MGGLERELVVGYRDSLRKTENGNLMSRLVGGGSSLPLTLLCTKFPTSVKDTGKIACAARSFAGSFYGKLHPARLSRDPRKPRVRMNRDLTGNDLH